MVIIYFVGRSRRRLEFKKEYARKTEDGNAWRIRIPDKKKDIFTEHVIPVTDISDIRLDSEHRTFSRNKDNAEEPTNYITGI